MHGKNRVDKKKLKGGARSTGTNDAVHFWNGGRMRGMEGDWKQQPDLGSFL